MEIRDLGPLLIEQDGLPVAVGSGRLAAVLGPLSNRVGELVTPDGLVEAVWGEDVPARAGQLLESLIWRLRKQLEPGRAARAEAAVLRRDPQGTGWTCLRPRSTLPSCVRRCRRCAS